MNNVLIEGGRLFDPAMSIDIEGELELCRGVIAAGSGSGERRFDASGCLVVAGLIDFHTHIYHSGTQTGINPHTSLIPNGVTSALDAGSAGPINFEAFAAQMSSFPTLWHAYLNVSTTGLAIAGSHEIIEPYTWDINDFAPLFRRFPANLRGLKLRLSKEVVGNRGFLALERALEIAQQLDTCLCVHVTGTDMDQKQLIKMLRAGDVYCHMYQGYGTTILDEGVADAVLDAKRRGVIFDACHGNSNFSNAVAKKAMRQGFLPDVISSDISAVSYLNRYIGIGLPYVISKFLALGMKLEQAVNLSTNAPARLLGMQDRKGTLAEGADADIAIFRIADAAEEFVDCFGERIKGSRLLLPVATFIAGVPAWVSPEENWRLS